MWTAAADLICAGGSSHGEPCGAVAHHLQQGSGMNDTNNQTALRPQLENILRDKGFEEVTPGDWRSQTAYVWLDIEGKEGTCWHYPLDGSHLLAGKKEELSYDDMIKRFVCG